MLVLGGKVDVQARNASRETPLHAAAEKGMRALTRLLLDAGCERARAHEHRGDPACTWPALPADPACAVLLLDAGAVPPARNDEGESALHWAALSGNAATVRLLLERGADPELRTCAAIPRCTGRGLGGHVEAVRLLLRRARAPGAKNLDGKTAQDLARERGHEEIVVAGCLPPPRPGRRPAPAARRSARASRSPR